MNILHYVHSIAVNTATITTSYIFEPPVQERVDRLATGTGKVSTPAIIIFIAHCAIIKHKHLSEEK